MPLQDVRERFRRMRDVRTVERAWTEAYTSGDCAATSETFYCISSHSIL
jgi:hypothetical protein